MISYRREDSETEEKFQKRSKLLRFVLKVHFRRVHHQLPDSGDREHQVPVSKKFLDLLHPSHDVADDHVSDDVTVYRDTFVNK